MTKTSWTTIAESQYPWERDALDFLRARFPDQDPYRAWSNFEFIADDGSVNEVDLLVLTPAGFFLVEIKSRPGIVRGDAGTWTWEHEGRLFTDDNPVIAANRKAKKLKSLLERQKAIKNFKGRLPFLDVVIFCSAPDQQLVMEGTARYRVCLRDQETTTDSPARPGILAALQHRDCPGLDPQAKGYGDRPTAKAISQALEQAGIRPSRRSRKVGDFVLNNVVMEGPGFQDWQATHVKLDEVKRRVRLYLIRAGATVEDRKTTERAALREFQLLESLQHPGILRTYGFTEHELGSAIIFEHFPKAIRLDHYLAQVGQRLTPETRLDLLRQIAEVVRFAHDKKVVHRALSPQSILVLDADSSRPHIKVLNWQVGYRDAGSTTGGSRGRVTGTVHVDQLVEDASTAYMAPEALADPESIGEHLDVFSLGAIAYHLFSGRPPASNALELSEILRQSKGLQISAVLNGAGENLQHLVQSSTHAVVGNRTESAREFLEDLDKVQRELIDAEHDVVEDPTQAQADDKLAGGLVVKQRLGTGACSVALLVERDGQELVLKVANSPDHNDRLRGEGEVLQKLRHQHIVEHLETLELGGRVCLLMRRAGQETLGERLRKEGWLHMDLLQRFGEDLLDVVRFIEEQGLPHRDITPDNIAVGPVGRGDKLHLVLFDFSLSRTPPENIRAGTAGYLEPFLASRRPPRWDLYAERYAAAVTLYELATGAIPKWGDGKSAAEMLDCEVTIEAELFDANLREPLGAFFRKSLRRNPAERFDNAEEMLRDWRQAFEGLDKPTSAGHEERAEVEKRLQQATVDTPIAELGLGTRACNALDRVNVLNVRDLLAFPQKQLHRMPGVGYKTRREITDAMKVLRGRLGTPTQAPITVIKGPETTTDEPESVVMNVDLLCQRVLGQLSVVSGPWSVVRGPWSVAEAQPGQQRTTDKGQRTPSKGQRTKDRFLLAFLGLDPDLTDPWPNQNDVAVHLGVTRARVGQLATAAQERWRRDPSITRVRTDIAELLTTGGGVMSVEELAAAVLLARGSAEDEPYCSRLALAVTRAAVEVERVTADPRLVVRRVQCSPHAPREDCRHAERDGYTPGRVIVAITQELADYAVRLGREADALATEDPLAAPARVLERLRAVRSPAGTEPIPDARLLRLAASSSHTAAVSSRQEMYPRGMDCVRALRLSQLALLGVNSLTEDQIRQRVSGRYPDAARLPDRPELNALLHAGCDLDWLPADLPTTGTYVPRAKIGSSIPSTPVPRLPTQPGTPSAEITPEIAKARQFEERLQRAMADGAFVAMTVEPRGYFRARDELCSRFPIQPIDLESTFLRALHSEADKVKGLKWEKVLQADAMPGSDDWGKLMLLVRRAMPEVERAILSVVSRPLSVAEESVVSRPLSVAEDHGPRTTDQEQRTTDNGPRAVLLVYPGLLARYAQMDMLQRLREKVGRPDGIPGLWMLIAADESTELPVLDGHAVPVIGRAEWARIPDSWLRNEHRGGCQLSVVSCQLQKTQTPDP
ncbi:MAG: BREX system serine/threonine kinase PglW [Planctomycetota bacterium]|nr:BREX system serine/threonine kinase PglW [Planctomycetota bacterium]